MKNLGRWHRRGLACLGLALAALTGCQTYYGGGTYPSPRYLEHPPTYIPESPPFPYARELEYQRQIAAQPEPGAPQGFGPRVPGRPNQ